MSEFARPTLAELLANVQADVETELSGVSARLRHTPEYALARAMAGLVHLKHGHSSWVAEQILPDEASERFLVRYAQLFDVLRKQATPATGTINVTGSGGDLTAGDVFVRDGDGARYLVDADVLGITTDTATVTSEEVGETYNLSAGATLRLESPIAGVDDVATVAVGGLAGGTDIEELDALLERLLEKIRKPPMGGAPGDHVIWAKEMAGVTRAWEYRNTDNGGSYSRGKIAVTFVLDDDDGTVNIPDAGQVAAMQAYLDDRSPFEVEVFAPTPVDFDYTVTLTPNNVASVEAAVEAEVKDMLQRDAEPGGTVYLSRFNEAVSAAAGETDHLTAVPAADVPTNFGELLVYGTPTFS